MSASQVYDLHIRARFPSLNELLRWSRASPHKYAKAKKTLESMIGAVIESDQAPAFKWARISYTFLEPNEKRDPSNIAAAGIKIIEDALVRTGVLSDDGWETILAYTVRWEFHPGEPGVLVRIQGEFADEPRDTIRRRKAQEEAKKALGRAKPKRAGSKRLTVVQQVARQAAERRSARARSGGAPLAGAERGGGDAPAPATDSTKRPGKVTR